MKKQVSSKPVESKKSEFSKKDRELVAKLLGPEGEELLAIRDGMKKVLGEIDADNPSPQAVARAVLSIGGLFDHLIFCMRLKMAVNELAGALERARPYLSAKDVREMEQSLSDGRLFLRNHCPAMEPNA